MHTLLKNAELSLTRNLKQEGCLKKLNSPKTVCHIIVLTTFVF